MKAYCDTNFLVRVFVAMPGSEEALGALETLPKRGGQARVAISWLHRLEVANAFQQLAFLSRQGIGVSFTVEQASVVLSSFEEQLKKGTHWVATPVAAEELAVRARALSLRHTAKHGFRAYDIAHVSTALLLGCDAFWSFDAKANRLALLEGLAVL